MGALRLFSLIAIFAALYYIVQVGGISVFFASRQDTSQALDQLSPDGGQATRAIVSATGSVTSLVALVFYIHVKRSKDTILSFFDIIVVSLLVGLNLVVNNPISNSRYWALAVIFGLSLPFLRDRKTLFNAVIGSGIFAAIFIFPLADITRRSSGGGGTLQVSSVWELIATKDYDQFSMLTNTISFTNDTGFAWGRQLLGALLFWVPRSVWSDKPLDTGVEVGQWMNSVNVNLSSPFWAEMWVNFGYIGVIVGFFALGRLSRRLDWSFHFRRDVIDQVDYLGISIFVGYLFILLRGSLLQSMGRLMILVLSILLLSTTVKSKTEVQDV